MSSVETFNTIEIGSSQAGLAGGTGCGTHPG